MPTTQSLLTVRSAWHVLAAFALAATMIAGAHGTSHAQARQPERLQGSQTLYQRILTRPQATLTSEPGGGTEIETFPPFEMFYVYGQSETGGEAFIEVGRTMSRGPEGWIAKNRTIEWRQAVVLGFSNPANRDRALLFRSRPSFEEAITGEDVLSRLADLRSRAAAGELDADGPVVSIEPEEFIDIEREFYILPILEWASIRLPTRMPAKLLKVASLSQAESAGKGLPRSREELLRDYEVGIVFVIDTTKSMAPYIEQVRDAVAALKERLSSHEEAERFRFGLVGFRDNTQLASELGYVTRTYLPLDEEATAERFLEAIDEMDVATANSVGFNEDAVAGVKTALDENDWGPFGGRYVILITDAGPRAPGPDAKHKMLAVPELQIEAQSKQTAIYTLHLQTPAGRFDHESAADAYRALSRFGDSQTYYPIEEGGPEDFRAQVDILASRLTAQITDAMNGMLAGAQADEAAADDDPTHDRVGRAMQLAYLGREAGTQAPEIFEGWMTDRDPVDRYALPVAPYILLSRNELSTLYDVMRETVALGRESSRSDDFITRLREQAALVSRSPEFVQNAGTLGDVLGEYLDDLPYNSSALSMTDEAWRDLSATDEQALLDSMESKMESLSRMHSDSARWWAPSPDAPAGEYLTIVPLSLMP